MRKQDLFKLFLVSLIGVTSISQAPSVMANEYDQPDIEAWSGRSKEKMQEDFNNYASTHKVQLDENQATSNQNQNTRSKARGNQYLYLSDINYDSSSRTGWGKIEKDKNVEKGRISLLIDGKVTNFNKGMGVHAPSSLIYDVRSFKNIYTHLSTYIGINYRERSQSDGVEFVFYGSNSKNGNWTQLEKKYVLHPYDDAQHVKVSIQAFNYIKLESRTIGHNYGDHSVYADLKLERSQSDQQNVGIHQVKTLEEYDREISKYSVAENYANHKKLVLKREFVRRIGYDTIQNAYKVNPDKVNDTLTWLFSDLQNLQLFIEAGDYFSGNGKNAFDALVNLYSTYHGDMYHYVYKKMLLATAAAYSKDVHIFLFNYGGERIKSDPLKKYEYFKKLYNDGKFVRKTEFENYPMELMRSVMDAKISNEEIYWLRDYIERKYPYHRNQNNPNRYSGHGYTTYQRPDWQRADFYDQANKNKWNRKYDFLRYGIDYGVQNKYRLWMLMEQGGICWGISGLGMVVNEVQGIPAIGTYQPGHEAYLLYKQNANGKGIWNISYDLSGWRNSYTRWGSDTHSEHRLPLQWGQKDYNQLDRGYNTSYIVLAQDALNNYDQYLKSMYYVLIANSYQTTDTRHEEALEKSLTYYSKNLDALHGLYKAYRANGNTTEEKWVALAKRVAKEYRYYPAPMFDLLKNIKGELKSRKLYVEFLTMDTLKAASNASHRDVLQPEVSRDVAKVILENEFKDIASISFDGEHANEIVLNKQYENNQDTVLVSADGGRLWYSYQTQPNEKNVVKLSYSLLAKLNARNDLLIGVPGIKESFKIDLQEGQKVSNNLYKNDDENVLIGDTQGLEYSQNNGITWQDYQGGVNSNIRFTGNTVVKFRKKGSKNTLPGPAVQYEFHQDQDTAQSKYLSLKHVSVYDVSSEETNAGRFVANNLIDGLPNTYWHTKYNQFDKRYIAFEFDQIRSINKLKYLPYYGGNGLLEAGDIYTSINGRDWEHVHHFNGLLNNHEWKTIDFGKTVDAKYIKIQATKTYGNKYGEVNQYFTGSMLHFYEDTTREHVSEPIVEYSTTSPTKSNVTAKLKLPHGYEAVGDSEYVFTKNGSTTFFFRDLNNQIRPYGARVNWIQ